MGNVNDSRNASVETLAAMSRSDRLSMAITRRVFTVWMFVVIIAWTVAWVAWQLLPFSKHFDPLPGLVIYLLLSNFVQLMLMPLIGAGQAAEAKFDVLRAHIDHENGIWLRQALQLLIDRSEDMEVHEVEQQDVPVPTMPLKP